MDQHIYTPLINDVNVKNVQRQIELAKQPYPYRATIETASDVLTDYDTFPYTRWWRGVPDSYKPMVAEREAGWRPRHDHCYMLQEPPDLSGPTPYPNHCFQSACNTTYPCYPEYLQKLSDKAALESLLNKACIVQFR